MSSSACPPDHPHPHLSPSEQLCYVHCNSCDTVLAVIVPSTSLFKTVTVRCGHCTNLLSVNMRGLLLPESFMPVRGADEFPKLPAANKPPEKRQRVPSAYNRFIKDEIQRIKAENPDITHREAFSAAAKNWAHFPHIHFGLMPEAPVKKANVCQQEGEGILMKAGFLSANVGVSPF